MKKKRKRDQQYLRKRRSIEITETGIRGIRKSKKNKIRS